MLVVVFALLLAGSVSGRNPCDSLVPDSCVLPFPNDFYTRQDASSPTGKRVDMLIEDLPYDNNGQGLNPAEWNKMDGFSASGTIMTYFGDQQIDLTASIVPTWKDISVSLGANGNNKKQTNDNVATVLINAATGEIVPHWAELDESSQLSNSTRKAFLIQPAQRLADGTRYIIGIRHLVSSTDIPVQPSPSFRALRDGTPAEDPDVESRRSHYESAIFPFLEAAGFLRSSLQIAWDFTTASRGCVTNRAVHARDDALARLPANPTYEITSVQDEFSENLYRVVQGTVEVPFYTDHPGPYAKLVVDEDDLPVFQYWQNVTFTLTIPRSLWNNPQPARLMQYGHGLLGSQDEVTHGWFQDQTNKYGFVALASNWLGMSSQDIVAIVRMMATDFSDFYIVPDRTIQGFVAMLVIYRTALSDGFVNNPVFARNGTQLINREDRVYYGNSQGAILGSGLMALHTDIENACFGVGGHAYAVLLPRSVDFYPFFALIKARYDDPIEHLWLVSPFSQMLWDRGEGAGYMHVTTSDTLPNTPAKRILAQYSLHDAQVSWLGQHIYARSIGAQMFQSNVREGTPEEVLFGFPFVSDTAAVTNGSVVVGWDYSFPDMPIENIPPAKEEDTHSYVRRSVEAQEMMDIFWNDGRIINTCGGPCLGTPSSS